MDPQTCVSEFISNISCHRDVGESSQNHGDEVLPHSLTIAALVEQDDYFQNAFVMSSSFQTHPINQNPQGIEFPKEILLEPDSGQSNQRKRKVFELENSKCLHQVRSFKATLSIICINVETHLFKFGFRRLQGCLKD